MSLLLSAVAAFLSIPVAVLFVEVVAAVVLRPHEGSRHATGATRPRIAVLVPAHNESSGRVPTLEDLMCCKAFTLWSADITWHFYAVDENRS